MQVILNFIFHPVVLIMASGVIVIGIGADPPVYLLYLCSYLQGGEPDINAVAKNILNDFQRGKLPYFVKPPASVSSLQRASGGS